MPKSSPRVDAPPDSSDPSHAGLLAACHAGDGEAFAELYRSFARVVHGIVLARVGPEEAEDVTQEVFMKVHKKLGSLRDAQALPAWICSVARNQALDHGRHRQRRPQALRLVEEPAQQGPAQGESLAEHILVHIQSLPESYRETLVLRLVEGMTGPEIAARCGMTHGSVRVNLSRGMALLRPLLEKEGWA